MPHQQISDQASSLYAACYEEIRVSPNGDRWDVFDGVGDPLVGTVDAAVLQVLDDTYDMPVQTVDGSSWSN